jgi:hypothetical protein
MDLEVIIPSPSYMSRHNNFTYHATMIAIFVYYKLDLDFSIIFTRYVSWVEWRAERQR